MESEIVRTDGLEPENSASENSTQVKKPGKQLFSLFIVVSLLGLCLGIVQANNEFNTAWQIEGYDTLVTNTDFQIKRITADECSNAAMYGCWLWLINSKYDCNSVLGTHSQIIKSSNKELEYIDAKVFNITRGEPFRMEFKATSDQVLVGDLFHLECNGTSS